MFSDPSTPCARHLSGHQANTTAGPRNFTGALPLDHQFNEFTIKTPRFNLILARFTANTYVLVVIPPGEAEIQCTRLNVMAARDEFSQLDNPSDRGREELNPKRLNGGYGLSHDTK